MKPKQIRLTQRHATTLATHRKQESNVSLRPALRLGSQAVAHRLGTLAKVLETKLWEHHAVLEQPVAGHFWKRAPAASSTAKAAAESKHHPVALRKTALAETGRKVPS